VAMLFDVTWILHLEEEDTERVSETHHLRSDVFIFYSTLDSNSSKLDEISRPKTPACLMSHGCLVDDACLSRALSLF
jgi:hypothetical protein